MIRKPSHAPLIRLWLLSLLSGFALSGCGSTGGLGSGSGFERFTTAEMSAVDADELRNLQFFTSSSLRFSTGEQPVADSIRTASGQLMRIQTRQHRTVEIPGRTPGVLVEGGPDWLDLDVGDGVVLRFKASGDDGAYMCVAFNGQPVEFAQGADPAQIDFEGTPYELVTAKPVYLEYYVRHVINVDRESQRIRGKRIDDRDGKITGGY